MHVADVMSKPVVTCRPDESLSEAAQKMWEHDCGVLTVVGDERQLVGMITDRDICMATWSRAAAPPGIRVADAMANQVVACTPVDTVERALRLMAQHQVRRLPVVDANFRVVGLLSLNNLIRYAGAVEQGDFSAKLIQALASISQRRTSEASAWQQVAERPPFEPPETVMH